MAKVNLSTKRLAIDKANSTMLIAVGVAAFVVVFSLVASKALLDQRAYQAKVIDHKKIALKQLETNLEEVQKLEAAYKVFAGASQNALGGSPTGNGDRDGENPRIVLDALPSKYDFPALATSFEKLFIPYNLQSITGTDDEIAQASNQSSASPEAVDMPFSVTVETSAGSIKPLLEIFEKSIRPMQIEKLTLSGADDLITIDVIGKTYFQPEKTFNVTHEAIPR